MPPTPCARPVTLVPVVTAAVTGGPAPPMVIDMPLTARTRPVRATRSWPARAGTDTHEEAETRGAAPMNTLADGVPLIRKNPAATPAAAAAAATRAENPGTPPWPQRLPAAGPAAGSATGPAAGQAAGAATVAGQPSSSSRRGSSPESGSPSAPARIH